MLPATLFLFIALRFIIFWKAEYLPRNNVTTDNQNIWYDDHLVANNKLISYVCHRSAIITVCKCSTAMLVASTNSDGATKPDDLCVARSKTRPKGAYYNCCNNPIGYMCKLAFPNHMFWRTKSSNECWYFDCGNTTPLWNGWSPYHEPQFAAGVGDINKITAYWKFVLPAHLSTIWPNIVLGINLLTYQY